jgi:hypothetical protein
MTLVINITTRTRELTISAVFIVCYLTISHSP